MSLTARPIGTGDPAVIADVFAAAFLHDELPAERAVNLALVDRDRHLLVRDETGTVVSVGGALRRRMGLPGGTDAPVAAVTAVGTAPDQRRRGGLRTLMRSLLDDARSAGEPLAILWASEAVIYGRFGFAVAAYRHRVWAPGRLAFRPGVAVDDRPIRLVSDAGIPAAVPALHQAASGGPGWITRPPESFTWWLDDEEAHGPDAGRMRWAMHPVGYAAFRPVREPGPRGPQTEVRVVELVAAEAAARLALWRFLLDLDLITRVAYPNTPLDDALPLAIADPRALTLHRDDQLWVRLVDLPAALTARRYAGPCDVVLEVRDTFCPANAGRWRLHVPATGQPGTPAVAHVEPSTADPALTCDITDLAAAYLGSVRLTSLAAAGRLVVHDPRALTAACRAFAGDVQPYCVEVF